MAKFKKTTTQNTSGHTEFEHQIAADVKLNQNTPSSGNQSVKPGSTSQTGSSGSGASSNQPVSPASGGVGSNASGSGSNASGGSGPVGGVSQPMSSNQTAGGGSGAKPNVQYPGENQEESEANADSNGGTQKNGTKEKENNTDKDKDKEKDGEKQTEESKGKPEEKGKEPEGEKKAEEAGKQGETATKAAEPASGAAEAKTAENTKPIDHSASNQQRVENIAKDAKKPSALANSAKNNGKDVLTGKQGVGEAAGNVAKDVVKKPVKKAVAEGAKKVGQVALKAVMAALQAALDAAIAAFGWPVLIACAAAFLVIMLIFAGLACSAADGYFGKTYPSPSGPSSPIVSTLKSKTDEVSKAPDGSDIFSKKLLDYFDATDKKYVEDGLVDKRLAEALAYLASKHSRIGVSHIISAYKDMPTDPESGADRDPALVANVSAHKDGLAADIAEIDYFYKVQNYNIEAHTCSMTFFNDGTGAPDLSGLGDGTTLTPDTLSAKVDEIANVSKYNLEASNELINTLRDTLNTNQVKIKKSLDDPTTPLPEFTEYTNTQNDLTRASAAIADMQGKMPATYDKVKSLNQQVIDFRTKLSGSSSEEAAALNEKLATAQTILNESLNNYSRFNEIISDVNEQLDSNIGDLNTLISAENPGKDDTKAVLKDISFSANYLSTLDSFTYIVNIGDLISSFERIATAIGSLIDMISSGKLEEWAAKIGDLGNDLNIADSILGGSASNPDKLFERGCSPDEIKTVIATNTMYKTGADADGTVHVAQAIPIKVAWQDKRPADAKVGDVGDLNLPKDPYLGLMDFQMVYQPEARRKTHQVVAELLQFPYDKGDINRYKVTQLITFSKDRDVTPFASILDTLYGKKRPANHGLFDMPEAWAQVHIGY